MPSDSPIGILESMVANKRDDCPQQQNTYPDVGMMLMYLSQRYASCLNGKACPDPSQQCSFVCQEETDIDICLFLRGNLHMTIIPFKVISDLWLIRHSKLLADVDECLSGRGPLTFYLMLF